MNTEVKYRFSEWAFGFLKIGGGKKLLHSQGGSTVTGQKSCTIQIILYPLQAPGNSYHIYMVIYTYSIYIFDMNMRSGSHALLHVEKSEKKWSFESFTNSSCESLKEYEELSTSWLKYTALWIVSIELAVVEI